MDCSGVDYCDVFMTLTAEHLLTLILTAPIHILTAPIHCRASIDSHSDGTHSLQSIHWLSFWRHPFTAEHLLTLILTAPIHCRASIDSHSDGTHSLQSIHWLSFWRHPFTAEHPLTLILTAPIHCRASIDSHSDGTHSLQSIYWLSFWRHPFTAEHLLTLILTAPIHCRASIDSHSDGTHSLQSIHCWDTDAMLHFSKSDEEANSSTSCIAWGWAHFRQILIFGWSIHFSINCWIQLYKEKQILQSITT